MIPHRLHTNELHLSLTKRNQLTNTNYNANNSKYAYRACQIPINTPLAQRNPPYSKHFFQNQDKKFSAGQELQFQWPNFPLINKHSNRHSLFANY